MVSTSCSQMLHQHPVYVYCDFLQKEKGSSHIQIAEEWGCYSSSLPFPFDLLDSVLTPLSKYRTPENISCLLTDRLPISQRVLQLRRSKLYHTPIIASPPIWKKLDATFAVWLIKLSGRQACYRYDRGRGSLTSVGCQVLLKVEDWIHFSMLASVTLSLPKRQRNSSPNCPDLIRTKTKN